MHILNLLFREIRHLNICTDVRLSCWGVNIIELYGIKYKWSGVRFGSSNGIIRSGICCYRVFGGVGHG